MMIGGSSRREQCIRDEQIHSQSKKKKKKVLDASSEGISLVGMSCPYIAVENCVLCPMSICASSL